MLLCCLLFLFLVLFNSVGRSSVFDCLWFWLTTLIILFALFVFACGGVFLCWYFRLRIIFYVWFVWFICELFVIWVYAVCLCCFVWLLFVHLRFWLLVVCFVVVVLWNGGFGVGVRRKFSDFGSFGVHVFDYADYLMYLGFCCLLDGWMILVLFWYYL